MHSFIYACNPVHALPLIPNIHTKHVEFKPFEGIKPTFFAFWNRLVYWSRRCHTVSSVGQALTQFFTRTLLRCRPYRVITGHWSPHTNRIHLHTPVVKPWPSRTLNTIDANVVDKRETRPSRYTIGHFSWTTLHL